MTVCFSNAVSAVMGNAICPENALLSRHPQLDHHSLLSFVIDQEVAMQKKAPVVLKVCAGDGFASWTLRSERRGPEHDVLAIKSAVALTDRHRRLPRVVPDRREAIRLRIETGDSGARALSPVRIE